MQVKPQELQLRDVVSLTPVEAGACYMTATVFKIKDDEVHLWRPYVHTSEFEMVGGVIPYLGLETVVLSVDDTRPLTLLERRPVALMS